MGDPANEWLESVAMRPMLEALLESVCKDKPDHMLEYSICWMRQSFPEKAEAAAHVDVPVEWAPRADVEPTPDALMAYLKEVDATVTLEGIIERAIREMPGNVVAFVIEELAALINGSGTPVGGDMATDGGVRLGANLAAAHPDSPKLFEAVASGDADALVALLEAGVHPDVREFRTNGTALIAAAEGEIECLEALLSYGAAVDAQNKQGETALMAAIKYSDGEATQALVSAGADKEQLRDMQGLSALDHAREMGVPELLAILDPAQTLPAAPPPAAPPLPKKGVPRRCSVSSESIDPNKKVDLSQFPAYDKTPEAMARINESLNGNILFKGLDPQTRSTLIYSMEVQVRVWHARTCAPCVCARVHPADPPPLDGGAGVRRGRARHRAGRPRGQVLFHRRPR